MSVHLGCDYMLMHGLACDSDRVDRSRMSLQLARGIRGTLGVKRHVRDEVEVNNYDDRIQVESSSEPYNMDACGIIDEINLHRKDGEPEVVKEIETILPDYDSDEYSYEDDTLAEYDSN
ncbi:hypothetical protein Sjap_020109 [Stephania japonica]|uniref:Uncharacterized protein n=1 Tax=Stephania japonica TaxID=461633 RepID=A0AAP0I062_9MAGN